MKIPQYCLVTAVRPEGWRLPTLCGKPWDDQTPEDRAHDRLVRSWYGIDREFVCLTTVDLAYKVCNSIPAAKACVTKLKKFGLEASFVELNVTVPTQTKLPL